jgi:hypothetical protein
LLLPGEREREREREREKERERVFVAQLSHEDIAVASDEKWTTEIRS